METLYEGFGWTVTMEEASLPDGRTKKVARVNRADGVHIIACPSDDTVLVLKEFRPYYGTYIWSLPGGRADKEGHIGDAAQRELQEETGYKAEILEHLWTVNVSESLGMTNHIFIAQDLTKSSLPQDADEMMEVYELSFVDALQRIESSPKVHLPSAYALRRYIDERLTN